MAPQDPPEDEDRVAQEAALWVARLSSADASAEDRRAFELWRAASPAHAEAFDDLSDLWSELGGVAPVKSAKATKPGGGGLVALLAAAGLGAALYSAGFVDRLRADHWTSVGEIRVVQLADGSEATLDTDSAIALRFVAGERRVELLRGQAFFAVAPDAARPFVVTADGLSATALGTRYEVARAPLTGPEVVVEEGVVEVRAGADRLRLEAGDGAARVEGGRLVETDPPGGARDAVAWREGRLVFSGRRLGDLLAEIGRYRNGPILLLDDRASALRVSGVFDLGDPEAALSAIEATFPVKMTRFGRALTLVRSAD